MHTIRNGSGWIRRSAVLVLLAASVEAQTTTRVSVNSQGVQANAGGRTPQLSADGRFVAFRSSASNLSATPSSSLESPYVHDRLTGATVRYGDGPSGTGHNGSTIDGLRISGDGGTLTWSSDATDFVAGDTNGADDVFVCVRSTGVVERVSVSSAGAQANARSGQPALSSDGRFVAFDSDADNLTPADVNSAADVFVRDRALGLTVLASVTPANVQGNYGGDEPHLSADGRWLVFRSWSTNLTPNDANQESDVFLRDMLTGALTCASRTSAGSTGNSYSYDGVISGDGRFVGFASYASDLVAGDTNGAYDVLVFDWIGQTLMLVSAAHSGGVANIESENIALSFDGRYAVFTSYATDLVLGHSPLYRDVFVRDIVTSTTWVATLSASDAQANHFQAGSPTISANGQVIAFGSYATNLVLNDSTPGFVADAYVRDLGSTSPPITVYCTAKTNSAGCTPLVSSAGEARASGPDALFVTSVEVLNNKLGLLFWSHNASATPFGGGTICAQPPLVRTPLQHSGGSAAGVDCTGSYSFHFSQAYMASRGLVGGSIVHCQFWSRDPGFAPPNSIGLSDAVRFVVTP